MSIPRDSDICILKCSFGTCVAKFRVAVHVWTASVSRLHALFLSLSDFFSLSVVIHLTRAHSLLNYSHAHTETRTRSRLFLSHSDLFHLEVIHLCAEASNLFYWNQCFFSRPVTVSGGQETVSDGQCIISIECLPPPTSLSTQLGCALRRRVFRGNLWKRSRSSVQWFSPQVSLQKMLPSQFVLFVISDVLGKQGAHFQIKFKTKWPWPQADSCVRNSLGHAEVCVCVCCCSLGLGSENGWTHANPWVFPCL